MLTLLFGPQYLSESCFGSAKNFLLPQPLSCFVFHLPNLLLTQNVVSGLPNPFVFGMAVPRRDNCMGVGVCIFIYSCSHTVKTIAFKRNPSGRTRIYEYTPPIIALGRALFFGGNPPLPQHTERVLGVTRLIWRPSA